MMTAIKFLLSLGLVLILLEGVARNLDSLIPIEVQQRFTRIPAGNGGVIHRNGRGARGFWPRQDRLQIAIFGSSIVGLPGFNDSSVWPAMIENASGGKIHIDNYGVGANTQVSAVEIMQSLKNSGLKYDIIILHVTPTFQLGRHYDGLMMSYQSRWIIPATEKCAVCFLLKKFWQRRAHMENQFINYDKVLSLVEPITDASVPKKIPRRPMAKYDRAEYQKMRHENRMVEQPYNLTENELQVEIEKIRNLFEIAKSLGKKVIWIPESTIYHPQMLPAYLDRFSFLFPVMTKEEGPFFLSPKGYYERFRYSMDVTRKLLPEYNITEISWHDELNQQLVMDDELFQDEFHLSEKGSQQVLKVIWPQFSSFVTKNFDLHLPELFKTESK